LKKKSTETISLETVEKKTLDVIENKSLEKSDKKPEKRSDHAEFEYNYEAPDNKKLKINEEEPYVLIDKNEVPKPEDIKNEQQDVEITNLLKKNEEILKETQKVPVEQKKEEKVSVEVKKEEKNK